MPKPDGDPALLTVREYAARYGFGVSAIYRMIEAGRVNRAVSGSSWQNPTLVYDTPPLVVSREPSVCIGDFDDYTLTLLWLSGTIARNDCFVVRNQDRTIPGLIADRIGRSVQHNGGRWVLKIVSGRLISGLRAAGFCGRNDASLPPPPVTDPLAFLAAFVECRASLIYALHHFRRATTRDLYYSPAVSFCASPRILTYAVTALSGYDLIPPRKLYSAANGTSAALKITSDQQLIAIRNKLSPIGRQIAFWDAFDRHISQESIPYDTYRAMRDT